MVVLKTVALAANMTTTALMLYADHRFPALLHYNTLKKLIF
jgi:hypothetical protein